MIDNNDLEKSQNNSPDESNTNSVEPIILPAITPTIPTYQAPDSSSGYVVPETTSTPEVTPSYTAPATSVTEATPIQEANVSSQPQQATSTPLGNYPPYTPPTQSTATQPDAGIDKTQIYGNYSQNIPHSISRAAEQKAHNSHSGSGGEHDARKKKRKKSNSGIVVLGGFCLAIVMVVLVALAGYGAYTLATGPIIYFNEASSSHSSIPEITSPSGGMILGETPSSTTTETTGDKLSTTEIAKRVSPSVVSIAQYSAFNTFTPSGEGSGIILNTDGYIVTNAHVVEGAVGINVELTNGETYSAQLIGVDSKTDLAVIKIEADGLVPAEFGSSDMLQVGEKVIAIGSPGGSVFAGSVSQGIISGLDRKIKDDGYSSNFIQTDAAINPGNSGGALVNEYGQVVGINSAKISAVEYEGIGFAIPSSVAKPVIDDLMTYGYVKGRTKLGISGQEINEALSQINSIPVGIYIWSIDATSDLAGKNITKGDIITAIDGNTIETFDDISAFLKTKLPGDVVTLSLYRSTRGSSGYGSTFEVSVTLMEDV